MRLDEGTRGVVDQHRLGGIVGEGGEARLHRIGACGAAADDPHAMKSGQGFGRDGFLALGDGHDQGLGAGGCKAFHRPAQHRPPRQLTPLFWTPGARSAADPRGGDHG